MYHLKNMSYLYDTALVHMFGGRDLFDTALATNSNTITTTGKPTRRCGVRSLKKK